MVGKVLQHPSSSVSYEGYRDVLDTVATLLPLPCKVVFCADRGFADTHLMEHLRKLTWHWRIRIKRSFGMYRDGHRPCKASRIALSPGAALFWHNVSMTERRYGPVHLAMAVRQDGKEYWLVISDEPTDLKTFEEYGYVLTSKRTSWMINRMAFSSSHR